MPLLTSFGSARGLGLGSGGAKATISGYSSSNLHGDYAAIRFTSSGALVVEGDVEADIMLIGGGRSGWNNANYTYCLKDCGTVAYGGKGGFGGYFTTQTISLTTGSYTISVGAGGTASSPSITAGSAGSPSSIVGGAININTNSYPHAFSDGSTALATTLDKFYCGHGGGASAAGNGGSGSKNPASWGDIISVYGGTGATGPTNNYWTGSNIYYGGGGGGALNERYSNWLSYAGASAGAGGAGGGGTGARHTSNKSPITAAGSSGQVNTGGGGGGGTTNTGNSANLGPYNGGSGIVIIRFLASSVELV